MPGVSNDEQFGGVGILVFDADNGHKFVRRIATWEAYRREAIEPIKGIAAHAGTGRLYVSTTRRLAAFDLATDKIDWGRKETTPIAAIRMAVSVTARHFTCRPSICRKMVCGRCRNRQCDYNHCHRRRSPQYDLFAAHWRASI